MQKELCLVAGIGLFDYEKNLIRSIFKANNLKPGHIQYLWVDDYKIANFVMVSEINNEAMEICSLLKAGSPTIVQINIIQCSTMECAGFNLKRPMSPNKILSLLNDIVKSHHAEKFLVQVFQGNPINLNQDKIYHSNFPPEKKSLALIVDDSPTACKQLKKELDSVNVMSDIVETGEQCLAMLDRKSYDIIFLDVVLPGLDGYEICKSIRKNKNNRSTIVILLTSKSGPFDRVRGVLAGCSSYLTKPVDYQKFHSLLVQYL